MFGKLFGKKEVIVEDQAFTQDFEDALKRYMGTPGGTLKYEFHDKKGNVVPPSHAFIGAYNQWKNIQSVWDKRSVIFSGLDEVYLKEIPIAQVVERLVIDRYPVKALEFVEQHLENVDFENPAFLASLSKCYFFLSSYERSIELANDALTIDKENKKAQIALADSLHLLNKHTEAHGIYQTILSHSKIKDWQGDSISVVDIIDFNNDILNSSVYAVGLLSNEKTDEATWDKVAEEFYHCAYFRSQHAYWLLKNDESLKGMAKLISTTNEFPWFKDAIINAKNGILQFREQMKSEDLWEEELIYLSGLIEENDW